MTRQQLNCLRKVTYSTRKKAVSAAMSIRDRLGFDLLEPYQCPVCRKHHLTKANEAGRKTA